MQPRKRTFLQFTNTPIKVYRAVLQYNNADTCEWENWYTRASVWYVDRRNAKKNLPELEGYLQHLKDNVFTDWPELFKFKGPYIEEMEIQGEFVPMNIPHDNEFYEI